MYKTVLRREGGYIPLPEVPGLGVELDDDLIDKTPLKSINTSQTPLRLDGSVAYAV